MANELRFSLLGGLRISEGEGETEAPLPGLSTQKGQALLCYLALTRRPHTRDALAGLMWSDDPQEEAHGSLRRALVQLRKVASPYLITTRALVSFNTDNAYWLDVEAFRGKIAAANTNAANTVSLIGDRAVVALREAMDLYKG